MHSMPIAGIPIERLCDYIPLLSYFRRRFLPIDLLSYLLANSFLSLSMEMLLNGSAEIVVFFRLLLQNIQIKFELSRNNAFPLLFNWSTIALGETLSLFADR